MIKEVIVTIDNFRTLARKTRGELLPPSAGYNAQNARFTEEYGSIEKRTSRAKYANMSTLGTSRVMFVDRFYKSSDSTKTIICAYSTFLKKGSDADGTFSNIKTGLTASLHWTSVTFKNIWYGCNGTDSPQIYDGSNVETMGVPVPGAATVATGAAGVLTGDYYYKVSYIIDSYQEGTAGTASALVQPSSEKVELSSIPVSTNTRCTSRYLYRTKAGALVYYFLAEIADNTTTTYSDNIADGSLDTTITAPTDYGVPSAFAYMCLHKSRVFGAKYSGYSSRVQYSDIRSGTSYPDVFPANNYFDAIKDNGEDVTFVGEDNFGQLIVMKPSAVIAIDTSPDDPVAWSGFTNILSVNGCISPYTAKKTHIGIIYLTRYAKGKKRLMRWTGSNSEPIFEELEPILSSISETRTSSIVGHYHNGAYYLSYTDPDDGNSYNDRVIIIDLKTGTWVIDKKNIDCFSSWTSGTVGTTGADEGELYSGTSDATGFIYREDTSIEDLLIKLKSDIDLGTLDDALTSAGTEAAPTLSLNDDVETQWGAKTVNTMTRIVNTLTGEQDYVFPSGLYTSPVIEVNAKNLRYVYWTQQLGSYGLINVFIRTGGTAAACAAASWSSAYTTSGSDISALTAARYIQYKIKLFIHGTYAAQYATVYLERGSSPNDYVVRISFGLGSISETAIEMLYLSQWLDFGWIKPYFKRVRKHFHQVRIDFERSEASGSLYFGYYLDGSSTLVQKEFAFSTYATKGYCIYQFPISTFAKRIRYRLFHDDDIKALKIKAVHFVFSPEPIGGLN